MPFPPRSSYASHLETLKAAGYHARRVIAILRHKRTMAALLTFVLLCLLVTGSIPSSYELKNLATYSTRPLWDKTDFPANLIPHYSAEGFVARSPPSSLSAAAKQATDKLCKLHRWKTRRPLAQVEVWDAVLFSTELDLLEIRIRELAEHVDLFVIVESDYTFTGLPRKLVLPQSPLQLPPTLHTYASKILFHTHPGRPLAFPSEDPFVLELEQRQAVTAVLEREMRARSRGQDSTVVLMGDVDEIPRAETVGLLKACVFEDGESDDWDWGEGRMRKGVDSGWGKIHLQLKQYLYSFEWPTDLNSWRLQAHLWQSGTSTYVHSKSTDRVLADAGWHCSFCFRTLSEFPAKMLGYSHTDRLSPSRRRRDRLLSPERIQRVLCDGSDLFGMLREAYTWRDMVRLNAPSGLERSASMVGLPRALVEEGRGEGKREGRMGRWAFLLPGGCIREKEGEGEEVQVGEKGEKKRRMEGGMPGGD